MENIKACPFCGRMARLIETDEPSNKGGYCVECHCCHACGPVVFGIKQDARPIAVDAWNRRASAPRMVVSATDEHPAILKTAAGKLVAGRQAGYHTMTPEQIELARHALGLPNKMKTSYRNRFVAGVGHKDYENWLQMVADGHAAKQDVADFGGASLFWLTEAGALQALKRGERLDPEDFTPRNQGRLKNRLSDGPALPREHN